MRTALRLVVALIAAFVGIAAAVNVFGDDAAVRADAEAVGCPRGCAGATSVRVERSPIAETVVYDVPSGTITVRCARAAILIGPFTCHRE